MSESKANEIAPIMLLTFFIVVSLAIVGSSIKYTYDLDENEEIIKNYIKNNSPGIAYYFLDKAADSDVEFCHITFKSEQILLSDKLGDYKFVNSITVKPYLGRHIDRVVEREYKNKKGQRLFIITPTEYSPRTDSIDEWKDYITRYMEPFCQKRYKNLETNFTVPTKEKLTATIFKLSLEPDYYRALSVGGFDKEVEGFSNRSLLKLPIDSTTLEISEDDKIRVTVNLNRVCKTKGKVSECRFQEGKTSIYLPSCTKFDDTKRYTIREVDSSSSNNRDKKHRGYGFFSSVYEKDTTRASSKNKERDYKYKHETFKTTCVR